MRLIHMFSRVFGCDGTSTDDIILQGMMNAYNDGNDIINLSLQDNSGKCRIVGVDSATV